MEFIADVLYTTIQSTYITPVACLFLQVFGGKIIPTDAVLNYQQLENYKVYWVYLFWEDIFGII